MPVVMIQTDRPKSRCRTCGVEIVGNRDRCPFQCFANVILAVLVAKKRAVAQPVRCMCFVLCRNIRRRKQKHRMVNTS
jgi:hypothetical protein